MGANKKWSDLADDFSDCVNDAIMKGDFSGIGDLVTNTVDCAINEAKKQTENAINDFRGTNYSTGSYNRTQEYIKRQNEKKAIVKKTQYKKLPMAKIKKVGKVSGILYTVFGGISLGIFSIFLILSLVLPGWGIACDLTFAALTALSGWVVGRGCALQDFVLKAERMVRLAGPHMYINIEDIASNMGKSTKYVTKQIRRMLAKGMFPEGHLDKQETCLMLTDDIYKEYLQAESARQVREQEEVRAKQEQNTPIDSSELNDMVREGNDCIRRLRDMNDAIEGEVISNKLFKLENLLKEIFAQVKEHPEKGQEMHKFMDYYLPTTLKLVEAYADFDKVSEPGAEIIEAKQQIENTLDTINTAFSELLNNLFRDRVFDVTTDAQVLQTLLSKEGLTRSDFELEKVPVK